jgi:hypothetical protein
MLNGHSLMNATRNRTKREENFLNTKYHITCLKTYTMQNKTEDNPWATLMGYIGTLHMSNVQKKLLVLHKSLKQFRPQDLYEQHNDTMVAFQCIAC